MMKDAGKLESLMCLLREALCAAVRAEWSI